MEMKKKQKTLSGMFLKFTVLFCVQIILILLGNLLLLFAGAYAGLILPANYTETKLTEYAAEIQQAGSSPEKWIPAGCTYGIYDAEGNWISGDFAEEERASAWEQYKQENIYASMGNYYRFIRQDNGNTCIVCYDLYMKYSLDILNNILPSPEILSFILDGILFILGTVLLSRYFAGRLNRQLEKLRAVTDKIAENDLEFETAPSDIREIDEVMVSLSRMRTALKESLTAQWDMEQQKQEQLASLTHDIKTPLTVIRGNAELLAEDELPLETRECTNYILSNVNDIEQYLEHIRQVLHGIPQESDTEVISCACLGEMLRDAAAQVASAEKIPVAFEEGILEGEVCCVPENILRAWKNMLSNGAERTDRKSGLEIRFRMSGEGNRQYLEAAVRDHGPGFSAKDLEYADREFYSGDISRHDRRHQGLGLAIARKFLEEQGGRLVFGNHNGGGAEVKCRIKVRQKVEGPEGV